MKHLITLLLKKALIKKQMAIHPSNIPENATDIKVNVVLLDIDDNDNFDIITTDIVFDNYEDLSNYQPVIKLSYTKITENGLIVIVINVTDEF